MPRMLPDLTATGALEISSPWGKITPDEKAPGGSNLVGRQMAEPAKSAKKSVEKPVKKVTKRASASKS